MTEKEVRVVIGANYGDEGKGLMTRYFCLDALKRNRKPVVVLHSGTAQRGHTVDYSKSFRHIYHHFGCGTLDGVPSYCAETFMLHPMTFVLESEELMAKTPPGLYRKPEVYYSPKCPVVTIYDLLVDSYTLDDIEKKKGERECGSCCFGSWCASERKAFSISEFAGRPEDEWPDVLELMKQESFGVLKKRCLDVSDEYFADYEKGCYADEHFLQDLRFFLKNAKPASFDEIWNQYDHIIFEGAQGLALDKDNGEEWHTTSNTGLKNPVSLIAERPCKFEACYATRSYLTKHGCGEFPEDVKLKETLEQKEGADKTNVPNEGQGIIRYAGLNAGEMEERIRKDMESVGNIRNLNMYKISIAMTHFGACECEKPERLSYVSRTPYAEDVKAI